MSGATEESLALLRRIAAGIDKLVQLMQQPASGQSAGGPEVASEQDLDGQWGNPELKKDPPRWRGKPYAPCRMSDTHPEYLDEVASFLDWQAGKDDESGKTANNGKPSSSYKRRDAARARGWAKRLRAGWKPARAQKPELPEDPEAEPGVGW